MFVDPDWSQPIDFPARLAAIPADAVVRGIFLQLLVDTIGPERMAKRRACRYVGFKTYPMREYVELLAYASECSRSKAPADCARRLGWGVYPRYAKTISGSTLFAIARHDFRRVIEAAPLAYEIALTPAQINVRELEASYARVELRDIYNLPDLHQVGIWEGAMKLCGVEGTIKTQVISFSAVDFEVRWSPQT
jgi:uncharacterized protein (TIGR02265 family)